MPRIARSWDQYPPEYMELLDNFMAQGGKASCSLASEKDANALRQDLYRWFAALQRACPLGEKHDPLAYKYLTIGRTIMIRVEDNPGGGVTMSLILRPLSILPEPEQWGEKSDA